MLFFITKSTFKEITWNDDSDVNNFENTDLNVNYSITGRDPLWPTVMKSLGDPYRSYIKLPQWLDQSYVNSVDW